MWHCSNDCVTLQQETFTNNPPDPTDTQKKLCLALSDAAPHRFVSYLGEDVGALLQQRDGRFPQAGGQLNPEQLLLLGEVVLQGVSQRHGGTPVGQGIRWKQASAQQLARWDAIRLWDKKKGKRFNYLTHLANQTLLCYAANIAAGIIKPVTVIQVFSTYLFSVFLLKSKLKCSFMLVGFSTVCEIPVNNF